MKSATNSTENLNPFSSQGTLTYPSFVVSLVALSVFNLLAFVILRSQLLPARLGLQVHKGLVIYGVWVLISMLGFWAVTNTFIKRWQQILDREELAGWMRSCARLGLLSPLVSFPLLVASLMVFSGSPVPPVRRGGSVSTFFGLILLLSVATTIGGLISAHSFGQAERLGVDGAFFRESLRPVAGSPSVQRALEWFPQPRPTQFFLLVANPGLRYLGWLAGDLTRSRLLFHAIEEQPEKLCATKLGYIGVEVSDCYFHQLRTIASVAPLVAPYFAFLYETRYRREATEQLTNNAQTTVPGSGSIDFSTPEAAAKFQAEAAKLVQQTFASNLLMLSNQLELLEPGPMFKTRRSLLAPSYLLRAFASPEIPLLELSQDIQRYQIISKFLPLFEMQETAIRQALANNENALGLFAVDVRSKLNELAARVTALRRDPLLIGQIDRSNGY